MAFDHAMLVAAKLHDLKNQTQRIMGLQQDLASALGDTAHQHKDALDKVEHATVLLGRQLAQLVQLIKLGGSFQLQRQECMVEDTLDLLRDEVLEEYPEIRFSLHIPNDMSWCYDEQLLNIALYNAAINAIQAGATELQVKVREWRGMLHIALIDNGSGIDELAHNGGEVSPAKELLNTSLGTVLMEKACEGHRAHGRSGQFLLENRPHHLGAIAHFCIP